MACIGYSISWTCYECSLNWITISPDATKSQSNLGMFLGFYRKDSKIVTWA